MSKVSIILPSYNHNGFLQDRLDSIVNQNFQDWELIIIDDKSSDGSIETLKAFSEKYSHKISKFIINEENTGSGYTSWKKGIELSKSEYIWIAETDDYSHPTFLEKLVHVLDKNSTAELAFCTSVYVDNLNNELYTSERRNQEFNVMPNSYKLFKGDFLKDKMPFNTQIPNGSAVVFRKPKIELPKELFGYKQCSDIFLWTFLTINSNFIFLNKPLNYFRRHENSTTTKIGMNNLKTVYQEKIAFLNYFNITDKYNIFIESFVKHYVWSNKKDIFNTSILSGFHKKNFLKFNYFFILIKVILIKIKQKH